MSVGDPTLGVVRHRGLCQVFHSASALEQFLANPDGMISRLLQTARQYPELIHLLELQHHFPDTALQSFVRAARNGRSTASQHVNHLKNRFCAFWLGGCVPRILALWFGVGGWGFRFWFGL